ncbi:MAG: CDP-alcohol phosphatidyltransferase family protein [Luteitalea sp.]|jgi:phosphatidylcholine synthase
MSQVRSGAALLVHAYTASGALLAWLALRSAWDHQPRTALLWLSVAVFVDATDGFAARAADVRRHASWIDGARLDDIVDFLTYVFVPMAILWEEGYLGGASGLGAVAAALIASGLGFANLHAKTLDYYFTGWPSYWNVIAVYALAWGWSRPTTTATVLVLAVLVFVPLRYVYPSRTVTLMKTSIGLGAIWAAQVLLTIWWLPDVPAWLLWSGLIYPVYYYGLSLWLNVRTAQQ